MKKNVTSVIFCNEKVSDIVKRHLVLWKTYSDNLLFVSPSFHPCLVPGEDCLMLDGGWGPQALRRRLFAMRAALLYDTEYYVFMEHDSFLLKRPEKNNHVQGIMFNEEMFRTRVKSDKCFIHPPWIFPSHILKKYVEVASVGPLDTIAPDVWVAQNLMSMAANFSNLNQVGNSYALNIAQNDFGKGYSRDPIEDYEHVKEALLAAQNGARAFHGVNSDLILAEILGAANQSVEIIEEQNRKGIVGISREEMDAAGGLVMDPMASRSKGSRG